MARVACVFTGLELRSRIKQELEVGRLGCGISVWSVANGVRRKKSLNRSSNADLWVSLGGCENGESGNGEDLLFLDYLFSMARLVYGSQ